MSRYVNKLSQNNKKKAFNRKLESEIAQKLESEIFKMSISLRSLS